MCINPLEQYNLNLCTVCHECFLQFRLAIVLRPCFFLPRNRLAMLINAMLIKNMYIFTYKSLCCVLSLLIIGSMNTTNFLAIDRSLTYEWSKFHTQKKLVFGFTLDLSSVNRYRTRCIRTHDLQFWWTKTHILRTCTRTSESGNSTNTACRLCVCVLYFCYC